MTLAGTAAEGRFDGVGRVEQESVGAAAVAVGGEDDGRRASGVAGGQHRAEVVWRDGGQVARHDQQPARGGIGAGLHQRRVEAARGLQDGARTGVLRDREDLGIGRDDQDLPDAAGCERGGRDLAQEHRDQLVALLGVQDGAQPDLPPSSVRTGMTTLAGRIAVVLTRARAGPG